MGSTIRVATMKDAPAIRAIYAPFVESTPISFEVEPPSTREMRARIERTLDQYPWLVCETADDEVIGYAAASELRATPPYIWTVELSAYVRPDAQQAGVGTALYTSLLETLEEQGYYNVYAVVTLPNPASVRLHKQMGFDPVGTFPTVGYKQGEWHDIQWWYRQLTDPPSDPDPPQPLSSLRETSELRQALQTGQTHLEV